MEEWMGWGEAIKKKFEKLSSDDAANYITTMIGVSMVFVLLFSIILSCSIYSIRQLELRAAGKLQTIYFNGKEYIEPKVQVSEK